MQFSFSVSRFKLVSLVSCSLHSYQARCTRMKLVSLASSSLTLARSQVQSGGSFDIDYSVVGPTDKVILDGTKERQGDFVFTANDVGEYRFCFNNEMSTFAEKMVDFEIAVCTHATPITSLLCGAADAVGEVSEIQSLISPPSPGRKRSRARHHPVQTRLVPRANFRPRRIHPQTLRPVVHHLAQPEILPHAREPQLQHGQEHRGPHLHLLAHGERADLDHGRAAGVHRQVLLSGGEERYFMISWRVGIEGLGRAALLTTGRVCMSKRV